MRKLLFILILLGTANTAQAVELLDAQFESTNTPQQFNSSTYTDYSSATLTWTPTTATSTYIVIANVNTSVDNVGARPKVRFSIASTTATVFSEYGDGLLYSDVGSDHGHSYTAIDEWEIGPVAHAIKIQVANIGTNNVNADNASIVVLEKPTGTEYAENDTELCTGAASGSFVDALSITPTPATDEVFAVLWGGEFKHEDEDNGSDDIRLRNITDGLTYSRAGTGNLVSATNDNTYFSASGFHYETVSSAGETIKVQMSGGGSADETCTTHSAIVAFPTTAFQDTFEDFQNSRTNHRAALSDTNVSVTDTPAATRAITFTGAEISNESPLEAGRLRAVIDTGTAENHDVFHFDDRDEDGAQFYQSSWVSGTTTTAVSHTWKVQGGSSSNAAAREAVVNRSYQMTFLVKGIANNVPEITDVQDSPDPVNDTDEITWEVNWQDEDGEGIKMLICKTDAITAATPSCDGGEWASNKDDFDMTDPIFASYTAQTADIGTQNYWAFVCDDEPTCSDGFAGTFEVVPLPAPKSLLWLRGSNGIWLGRGINSIFKLI